MKLDLSKVMFSCVDKERGIKIPDKLTPELAEDIGIHTGDGSINFRKNRPKSTSLTHSSNIIELDYLNHVLNLKKKLYNIKKYSIINRNNCYMVVYSSWVITTFYNTVFNIPLGRKDNIDVPTIIKETKDKEIISGFLRGLIDTDFGLTLKWRYGKIYPCLEGVSKSDELIKSISSLFKKLEIKHHLSLNEKRKDSRYQEKFITNRIIFNGYDRLNKVFLNIKPINSKYYKKIEGMIRKLEESRDIIKYGPKEI